MTLAANLNDQKDCIRKTTSTLFGDNIRTFYTLSKISIVYPLKIKTHIDDISIIRTMLNIIYNMLQR